ncbi:MAG: hypothetical protein LM517_03810 [Nitrosomonas sp.]|nr:hypothetical protein [Nitrosomonas sp.]
MPVRAFMLLGYPSQSHEMLFDANTHKLTALGGMPRFLMDNVIVQFPYQIDCAYSESDAEFKGIGNYAFLTACRQYGIEHRYSCSTEIEVPRKFQFIELK